MTDFFFARQPILDSRQKVFGYELLFRNSTQNEFGSADGSRATLEILSNAMFHSSFQEMVEGKAGLVNFTRDLLLSNEIRFFPRQYLVVEVLEDVVPDKKVISACRRLKKAGYRIALDDFIADDLNHPLLSLADIVKVDYYQAKGRDRRIIAEKLLPLNITLLAEKVETYEDFQEGLKLGYRLFQGYFFSKPIIKIGQQLAASHITSVRVLQAVFKDPFNYDELNEIISTDVSLSYRILKLVNSPFFGFRAEIDSTLHALKLMGHSSIKKFVSLLAVSSTTNAKPSELALICLARARMAEEMAPLIGQAKDSAPLFMTGLFSLLDAMLDCSMEEVMDQLSIAQEIKSALLGEQSGLRNTLDVIVAYEQGDWDRFSKEASAIGMPEDQFPAIYRSSLAWAADLLQAM